MPGTSAIRTSAPPGLTFVTLGAVLVPPLALGGAHPDWQVVAVAPVGLVGLVLAWRTGRNHSLVVPRMALVWVLVLALAALLQALPLGSWAPTALGGPGHRRADEVLGLFGVPTGHAALSLDPPSSAMAAAKALAVALVLLAVATLLRHAGLRRRLLWTLGLLGIAEVVLGLLQGPLGWLDLGPLFVHPYGEGLRTTLRNGNHAAALLNLATFCWIGLALDADRPRTRPLAVLMALGTGLGSLATWSRAGGAILVLLLVLFPLALALRRRQGQAASNPSTLDALRLLALSAVGLLLLALFQQALQDVQQGPLLPDHLETKTRAWARALDLVRDHPWTGVGRGAFGLAFTAYNDVAPGHFFDQVEQAPLQLLADLGLPLGLGLCLTGLLLVVEMAQRALATPSRMAVYFAVLSVLLQNAVDFSLEVPGVALPVAALVGLLLARGPGRARLAGSGAGSSSFLWRLCLAIALAMGGLAPLALSVFGAREHPLAARDRLIAMLRATSEPEEMAQALRREVLRHPSDAEILRIAARDAARRGDLPEALRRDEAALLLAPWHTGARRDQVRDLLALQRLPEALRAVRDLWTALPLERARTLNDLLSWNLPPEALAEALSDPPELMEDLRQAMRRRGLRGPLVDLLRVLRDRNPEDPAAWEVFGREAVEANRLTEAEEAGWWLVDHQPDHHAGWYLLGRVAWHQGRTLEARTLFRQAALDPTEPGDAGLFEAQCLLALGRTGDLARHLDLLRPRVARDPLRLARWHLLQASLADRLGAPLQALESLQQAIRAFPGLAEARFRAALLLRQMGRLEEARREADEARRLEPTNSRIDDLWRALGCDGRPAPRGCPGTP